MEEDFLNELFEPLRQVVVSWFIEPFRSGLNILLRSGPGKNGRLPLLNRREMLLEQTRKPEGKLAVMFR